MSTPTTMSVPDGVLSTLSSAEAGGESRARAGPVEIENRTPGTSGALGTPVATITQRPVAPAGATTLSPERLLDAHYLMTLARALDDRMWALNRQGKAPFVISGCGHEAAQIVHAAGIALASKIKREPHVTVVYFGEGCTAGGDFHEGLNLAGIHRLPVVFFCENNGYAISVPASKEIAVANVADRAVAYGMPGELVDGNDLLAVYDVMQRAVNRARRGDGPTLIEAKTYRLVPHSSDDDDRIYRSREEVEQWRRRDPLDRFRRKLLDMGLLNEALIEETKRRIAREVDDATDYAEQAPYPPVESLYSHVYAA